MDDRIRWPAFPPDRPAPRYCPTCETLLEAHEVPRCGVVHFCHDCGETFHFLKHREGVDPHVKRFNLFVYAFTRRAARALGVEAGLLALDPVLPSEAERVVRLFDRNTDQGRELFWKNWGAGIVATLRKKEQEK